MKIKNKDYYNDVKFRKYFEIGLRRYQRQMLSQQIKRGIADKRRRLEQLKIEQK